MLGQRRRQWINIKSTLVQRLIFAGISLRVILCSNTFGHNVMFCPKNVTLRHSKVLHKLMTEGNNIVVTIHRQNITYRIIKAFVKKTVYMKYRFIISPIFSGYSRRDTTFAHKEMIADNGLKTTIVVISRQRVNHVSCQGRCIKV